MRYLIRALLVTLLLLAQTTLVPSGSPTDGAPVERIVSCESDPAPDRGGVSIGTAVRVERTTDVAAAIAACDGVATILP